VGVSENCTINETYFLKVLHHTQLDTHTHTHTHTHPFGETHLNK